jgi:nitroreductase
MSMQKRPITSKKAGPLLPEILDRWSPRAFNPERILTESEKHSILEALRWGASSGNNQPWKLAWIDREDPKFDEFVSIALMEGNAVWAKNASALAVVITETQRNGEELDRALYTTGLAAGQMLMQVQYVGLFSHHMSGIHTNEISKFFGLSETDVVNAVVAIGEMADASTLPAHLAERELEPRERKQLEEIVIYGL